MHNEPIKVEFQYWIIKIFRVLIYCYVGIFLFAIYKWLKQGFVWTKLEFLLISSIFIFLYCLYNKILKLKIVFDSANITIHQGNKIESLRWRDVKSLNNIFFFKNLAKLTFKDNRYLIIPKNIGNYKILAEYILKYTTD